MPEGERILIILWHFHIQDMPDLKLDIIVVPTYNSLLLGITDASTYPTYHTSVLSPTIEINVPGFGMVILPFNVQDFNLYTSANLGITAVGISQPLPDGIYHLKYSVAPAYQNYVEKTIIRVDQLQEKFDEAFMTLDMMECDRAIKAQSKVELISISFMINGAIATANNCAVIEANKLYLQASKMLNNLLKSNCGCSGNNFKINYYY